MADPVFLTFEEVIEVHADQVRRYGRQAGLRDVGLLQSALAAAKMEKEEFTQLLRKLPRQS